MSTILQLLSDGADPKSVRCPHSALFIAVTSKCPTIVRHLVYSGANVHETYPQVNFIQSTFTKTLDKFFITNIFFSFLITPV